MKTLTAQLRRVQQRLGMRQELVAGIVLALLAAGAVSFTLTTRVGTPAGAAIAYMGAVDRADTDYVWSHSIVDSAPTGPATMSFVNRAGLAAQLKASAHTRSQFDVQDVGLVSSGTRVTLTHDTSAGRASISLVMRGGAPHFWPVLLEPTGLEINLPSGAGAVAIDGQPIESTTNGDIKVAVLPGHHILSVGPSRLFAAYTGDVYAERQLPSLTRADLSKVTLTDEGVANADRVVASAIQSCAASSALVPASCPQAYTSDTSEQATWTRLGDQSAGAKVGVNAKGQLEVTGHYLMQLNYASKTRGARVVAVGGPFTAYLNWDGQTLSVSGFSTSPAASAVQRPAATDADVLSPLKAQFKHCLSLQAGSAANCPQSVAAFYASNFVWHSTADPTQSATVAWDEVQGFFKVKGTYDFSVDYDSTPPYSPTRHYQDHSSGQYVADMYWDGSKAILVGFE
jgi:hypothetical protein